MNQVEKETSEPAVAAATATSPAQTASTQKPTEEAEAVSLEYSSSWFALCLYLVAGTSRVYHYFPA